FLDGPDHRPQLRRLFRRLAVNADQLADLGNGEAEPLAAQDLAKELAVARPVQPRTAAPHRLDQPLVPVETQGPRRDVEFARQLGNGVEIAQPGSLPLRSGRV